MPWQSRAFFTATSLFMVSRHASPAKSSPILTRADGAICAVLVLMILAVYWQTHEFAFVNFDDNVFVYNNQHVLKGLSWENLRWSMTAGVGKKATEFTDADYWRPLSLLSHMLDVSLFGLKAGAHHLMSVALHALTTVLLFLVTRTLTATRWRSAFVAAFFGVHPLHVESVAWVAERKDVLSGLFFVLALGAYGRFARHPFRWNRYLLVLVFGVMAMMSKPMLVTLPCVLLLLDFWPLNRLGVAPWKQLLLEKTPLFAMSALTALLTISGGGAANDVLWAHLPWYYRIGNALLSYGTYVWQTIWPEHLVCFYAFPGIHLSWGLTLVSTLMLITITALAWWWRERRHLIVGWLWYLGTLVPVIGLFRQAGDQAHADRYTYLAIIGLSFMIAWPAAEWAGNIRARRIALSSLAATSLLAFMVAAHAQASHWRNTLALWTHATACHPDDCAAFANLGTALIEVGRQNEAVESYQRALALSPYHVQARMNLGITLLRLGRFDEAEAQLRRTVLDDPQAHDAFDSLGVIFLRKGDLPQAIRHFQAAVNIKPTADAYHNLGIAQMQSGLTTQAIESFLKVTALDPSRVDSYFTLGIAVASQGRPQEAAEHYGRALSVDPNHLPSLNNLAWLLATSKEASLRDGVKAVKLIEHALQLPGGSQVHLLHALAAAQAETGQYPQAAATARQAIQLATQQNAPAFVAQLQKELSAYLASMPWRE